jgi:hypothetical protein
MLNENKTSRGNGKQGRIGSRPLRVQRPTESGRLPDPRAAVSRYTALAVSATAVGDHVEAQRYYQHAEHYIKTANGNPDTANGNPD